MIKELQCGWCNSKQVSFYNDSCGEYCCNDCIDQVRLEDEEEDEINRQYYESYLDQLEQRNK